MKNQKGFTLVELMVVVAIIGILSAVAIPNFNRYQEKSRMTGGKIQLSALYMAMESYYADNDTYNDSGYAPNAANIGYAHPAQTYFSTGNGTLCGAATKTVGTSATAACTGATAGSDTWLGVAQGDVTKSDPLCIMNIDQDKALTDPTSSCPARVR
jgi:type IV pilus assembly protein PilA